MRQIRAVDAKAAEMEGCNFGAIVRGSLNGEKDGRAGIYEAVESSKWKQL